MKSFLRARKSHKVLLSLSLVLAVGLPLAGALQAPAQTEGNAADSQAPAYNLVAGQRPAQWKLQNEQEWIVDGIGRDIAEILLYAKAAKSKDKLSSSDINFSTKTVNLGTNSYAFKLECKKPQADVEYNFALQDYAWSPQNFEPFAKNVMSRLQLSAAAPSVIPEDFLKNLAKADFAAFFQENVRISRALSDNPMDPSLHEQAALLQGTFNMLEICGLFSDTRAPLNRMSAHLAMAKALNQDKLSTVGQIANIALESMSCRDGIAVPLIEEMEKQNLTATEKSFLRALKIRGTANYRHFKEAESTPLEEYQYGLRYAQTRGIHEAMQTFARKHHPLSIQWKRILASGRMSVQTGHLIQAHQTSAEIADFIKNRKAYKNSSDENFPSFVDELNLLPTRCFTADSNLPLNVLSWDDVANFHSRHIANALADEYLFNARMYGVPELAARTKENAKKLFGKLTIFPLIQARFNMEGDEKYNFLPTLQGLMVNHPELLTSDNWKIMSTLGAQVAPQMVFVKPELWFDPAMPMGTVFYFRENLDNSKKNLAELTDMKRLMPYLPPLAIQWTEKKYGPHPTGEQYREGFGPLADFDINAMRLIAYAEVADPEKFLAIGEKMAKEDPSMYMSLGAYCVLHDMPDKAAAFYEKGVEEDEDAVRVSNECDWLVRYRYDHGQKAKAEELAQSAAEVYSARGLITLADFYERQGKLKEAEDILKKVEDRYENSTVLAPFYLRNAEKDKRYAQEASVRTKKIFPDGMKKVTLASFSGAPKTGMEVTGEDWVANKSPLKEGVVIVALNGYAAGTKAQFDVARDLTTKPSVWLIYWDGKEYKERTHPTVNAKWLRVDVKALEAKEATASGDTKPSANAKPLPPADRKAEIEALTKLKDNMMKQAEEMQKQNSMTPQQMLQKLLQQNSIPPAVLEKLRQQGINPSVLPGAPTRQAPATPKK